MKHTRTPWHVTDRPDQSSVAIFGLEGTRLDRGPVLRPIAVGAWTDEDRANMALIVRAVNAHADLLSALKWALTTIPEPIHDGRGDGPVSRYADEYAAARAALAKAEGATHARTE